jgi:hypothetical protein
MHVRLCAVFLLLACLAAWSQETKPSQVEIGSGSEMDLKLPPPVSSLPYDTTFEGEHASNYLTGGISFTSAYSSNVAWTTQPVSDWSYSIFPSIGLDKTTERMHLVLNYAPGFTFYQRVAGLNQANQNFSTTFKYQFSPRLRMSVGESLQKYSNVFDQPNPLGSTPVSGGVPTTPVAVIVPAADMFSNVTSAQLAYQIGENSLIGGGGNYSVFSYGQPNQVEGLYNSRTAGGSFFYATRVRERFYVGANYQYQNYLSFQANSPSTETQTQTIFFFATMYVKPNLSVSVSAGPQHYVSSQALSPDQASWQPLTMVSVNWQGQRTSLAASYARTVSSGSGLNGTFHTNNANGSFNWQVSRDWSTGVLGGYSDYQNLTPSFLFSSSSGHTLYGTLLIQRTFTPHFNIQFGYNWTHQAYPSIQAIATDPNVNRGFVTFNYTFSKPLQR